MQPFVPDKTHVLIQRHCGVIRCLRLETYLPHLEPLIVGVLLRPLLSVSSLPERFPRVE